MSVRVHCSSRSLEVLSFDRVHLPPTLSRTPALVQLLRIKFNLQMKLMQGLSGYFGVEKSIKCTKIGQLVVVQMTQTCEILSTPHLHERPTII